ncbi:MAG: hypothetical protein EOP64_08535 [Sphingomonas sp.]|nr:MAG: hypothetical protein EOP64_08535 [Sphingomonas sp.]
MPLMQTRLFGTDREDTKAARVLAAGGCLIAGAALAGAWLALPSLFYQTAAVGRRHTGAIRVLRDIRCIDGPSGVRRTPEYLYL